MASNSSKALPFLSLLVLVAVLGAEAFYDVEIDLEVIMPMLIGLGVSGAGLSAVKSASKAKKLLPDEIKLLVKEQAKESILAVQKIIDEDKKYQRGDSHDN